MTRFTASWEMMLGEYTGILLGGRLMVSLAMIGVSTGAMCWSRGERLVVVVSSIS